MGIKELPYSLEAEQYTLGAFLIEPSLVDKFALSPSDFYRPEHQAIYQSMLDVKARGYEPDIVLVIDDLRTKNKLDEVGGPTYIMQLASSVPNTSNTDYYVLVVKKHSIARQIVNYGYQIAEKGLATDIDEAKRIADKILNLSVREEDKPFSEIFTEEDFKRLASSKRWYSPNMPMLTRYVPFVAGENVYIAGHTSVSKTQLALDLSWTFIKQGATVGYVSTEIGKEAVFQRFINYEVNEDGRIHLRDIDIRDPQWQKIGLELLKEHKEYLHFHFTRDLYLLDDIIAWIENRPFDVVIIDYIQNIHVKGTNKKYEEMSIAARELRRISDKRCVVVLSQMHRENRDDDTEEDIDISSMRDSGVLEESATSIILLKKDNIVPDRFWYAVKKNQTMGTTTDGWIKLIRHPSGKFYEEGR